MYTCMLKEHMALKETSLMLKWTFSSPVVKFIPFPWDAMADAALLSINHFIHIPAAILWSSPAIRWVYSCKVHITLFGIDTRVLKNQGVKCR